MDTKVCLAQFVSWITKSCWLNFQLLASTGLHSNCSGLQGHFQFILQKQRHVIVTPSQHEVALQIFSFLLPF